MSNYLNQIRTPAVRGMLPSLWLKGIEKSQGERAKPWSYPSSAVSNLAARFYILSPWSQIATPLLHKRSAKTEEELTVISIDHWGIQSPPAYDKGEDGQQSPP